MSGLTQASEKILVSIVIPTKNEELTIEEFIKWVRIGLKTSKVEGEIILLDNSDDQTPIIASRMGARVYKPSNLGLGNAYKEAAGLIRGKYVILGDADCTYDFRDISGFLTALKSSEFVMGNRFSGYIEPGSMPLHHRYLGSPVTSWILKRIHRLKISDVHCGMRAMSTSLYRLLPFDEPGWEYAPEMVIRACQLASTYEEIPIRFLKAPRGRVSHFKRGPKSWFEPFRAGIGAIRVSLTLGLDRVTETLGRLLMVISSIPVTLIAIGPIVLFGIRFSTITQVIFAMFGLTGNLMSSIGTHLREFYEIESGKLRLQEFRLSLNHRFQRLFLLLALLFLITVFVICVFLWWVFFQNKIFSDFMNTFGGFIILLIYSLSITIHRILINIMSKFLTQAKFSHSST
jgi:glycosyltransferase involved in cell wall biosynthesis